MTYFQMDMKVVIQNKEIMKPQQLKQWWVEKEERQEN